MEDGYYYDDPEDLTSGDLALLVGMIGAIWLLAAALLAVPTKLTVGGRYLMHLAGWMAAVAAGVAYALRPPARR